MGLLDKIKVIFKKSDDSSIPEVERIELKQFTKRIDALIKDKTKTDEKIRKDLSSIIKRLDSSLRSAISELESIDLKHKKEHEKVKHVVM